MAWLFVIVLILLLVALYPVFRDILRRRQQAAPAYVQGLRHMLDGQDDLALGQLKEAVSSDTDNVDAYIRLGNIYRRKGDIERGIRIHENLALRRNLKPPEEDQVLRALAADYLETGRTLKAISTLEELLRLDRSNLDATRRLFRLYIRTESWDKCRQLLKEITKRPAIRPWAAQLLAEFGRAYARVDIQQALRSMEEALRLNPRSLAARLYLGDYHLEQNDTDTAVRLWTEIITLAPKKNYLVRRRIEGAYYELGRYDEIARLYEQLLRKVPDDNGLVHALCRIYQKKGDIAAAVQLLEKSRALAERDPLSLFMLAALYIDQGRPERSGRLLSEAIEKLQAGKYHCPACGAAQPEPTFSCPECHEWLETPETERPGSG